MSNRNFNKSVNQKLGFTLDDASVEIFRSKWKEYLSTTSEYPSFLEGKGIVICGGGVKYFTCAWVCINNLRNLGCQLPIELWYAGNELTKDVIQRMMVFKVTCVDAQAYASSDFSGVMMKPLAILHSRFKEVLYIDADNVCVKDPTYLFSAAEYNEFGALFWPDYWCTHSDNPIWKIIGCKYHEAYEQESGQILIDKEKCWKALHLCLHFNMDHDYYYKFLHGDKDTFRFAWMALGCKFRMISKPVGSCGYINHYGFYCGTTMVQHDMDGDIVFLHRNLLKWHETNTAEKTWQKIRRYKEGAKNKWIITNLDRQKYYISLEGEVDEVDFQSVYMDFEESCFVILNDLKKQPFYKDFVSGFPKNDVKEKNVMELGSYVDLALINYTDPFHSSCVLLFKDATFKKIDLEAGIYLQEDGLLGSGPRLQDARLGNGSGGVWRYADSDVQLTYEGGMSEKLFFIPGIGGFQSIIEGRHTYYYKSVDHILISKMSQLSQHYSAF